MRHDIQFLRGIAVLAVLFYHAKIVPVSGGYLGVDIFFVISGFLITSIILKDLDDGRFSFAGFYSRRAKRLLPAAYSTLIFSTLAAFFLLSASQWSDYIDQLIGAVTFTVNMVLPFQSGYFESAADGKPLLHAWSLSLEEQYYLTIPFLLILVAPRWRGGALAVAAGISLVACFVLVSFPFTYWRIPSIDSQTISFFSLPTRAWELLAGSLLAWVERNRRSCSVPDALKMVALLLFVGITFFPVDDVHPRGNALIAVLAGGVMLAGGGTWLRQNWMSSAIAKVGDWSYSLYLVHWPLFAFAHNAYLGQVPSYVRWALVPLSIMLACIQFRFIEQRFRFGWEESQKRTLLWLIAATLLVIFLPVAATMVRGWLDEDGVVGQSYAGAPNFGLDPECSKEPREDVLLVPGRCMTSDRPEFAVWGDSYAMHLVPGLKVVPRIGSSLVQITKVACSPILGVASIDEDYDESWAKGCLKFNESAIEAIEKSDSIKYVIMSSPFKGYFDEGDLDLYYRDKKTSGSRSLVIEQMVYTLEKLRVAGKIPILVAPPPMAGFNIGECLEREVGLASAGSQRLQCPR